MLDRRNFIKNTAFTTGILLSSSISEAFERRDIFIRPEDYFLHGVASGDPLTSKIVIWTRISLSIEGPLPVRWLISNDRAFTKIVRSGEVTAGPQNDYTVKVDVGGLNPSTIYYYQFIAGNIKSPVGKTRTIPVDDFQSLQFAVVSCSNYSAGYFNAFARISEKKELDAVIHLGDYIYEGTARTFDESNSLAEDEYESTHFNRTRAWWLHYYRRRYSINRLDPDLQAAHREHPFITIWDDHEIANNAWKGGADGHDKERDGEWEERKSAAKQAYSEWIPIRGDASKIYRAIRFGKMAELILLDTRLEGRDQQIYDLQNPSLHAPERTILGKTQKDWLLKKLEESPCQWKLIGNQVVFSEVNVQWAALGGRFTDKLKQLQNTLLDYWEGYPAERDQVINYVSNKKINNVVILSASMHCALAFDVTSRATQYSRRGQPATYNAATSKGSVAVEFAAPSINSENFDEKMGSFYATTFQSFINKKLSQPLGYNPNPHLKFADLQRHGYYILKLTKERAEASFYFVEALFKKTSGEKCDAVWHTKAGHNYLQREG